MAANGFAGGLPPPPDEQPDTLADGYMAPPETNLEGGDAGSVMSGGALVWQQRLEMITSCWQFLGFSVLIGEAACAVDGCEK
jgi:hypothetical protein